MMMMVRRMMMMMVTIPVLPAASFTFMRTIRSTAIRHEMKTVAMSDG